MEFRDCAMNQNRTRAKPNRLLRLMVANWALGWAVGFVCACGVLVSNVGGIRELMMSSELELQGLALLFGGFGFTFGGVVCATAIMLLPTDEESWNGGGGTRAPILLPAYALAKVRAARA
jgi:hypothetical protein